jgi:serine/threonine protein kinase
MSAANAGDRTWIDTVADRFEREIRAGGKPRIEDYVTGVEGPRRAGLLEELLRIERAYRIELGSAPAPNEYRVRFPEDLQIVDAVFAGPMPGRLQDEPDPEAVTPTVPPRVEPEKGADWPETIGRYRVTGRLGAGGFGQVFLARDVELERLVAIKVPSAKQVASPDAVEAFLAEARALAKLDHSHIVPVHDFGRLDDGRCYIVSKYIDGGSLAEKFKQARLAFVDTAELVAVIADALNYAHLRALVHRDVKPANILIDRSGRPCLADFGLALRDEDCGKPTGLMGTPAYMSPEQARGEADRVDGRTDIFSLGVVLYELLTGRRPFRGTSHQEVMSAILRDEPRPPRQIDDTIPKELERICLKAMSKVMTDRYTTALDMAQDVRAFLKSSVSTASPSAVVHGERAHEVQSPFAPHQPSGRPSDADNLLHAMWDVLDASLQDAFALAYNKKRRQGGNRISTKDFFQALVRLKDDSVKELIDSLPAESLPGPIEATVPKNPGPVLEEAPLLSDCVANSLSHFQRLRSLPRKLSPADMFVDIARHGHGASVARLRQHGIGKKEIEDRVQSLGLAILERSEE